MGDIEFLYGFIIIASLIFSAVIFTGKKLMFKYNYFYTLIFLIIVSGPLNAATKNPDGDYIYIVFILMIFVPMYLAIVFSRKETYMIENVKSKNFIDIITKYFDDKNIKYEVKEKEIYLPEHCKTIDVKGKYELYVNLKEIKKLSFYEELLEYIKLGIKNTEKKIFPIHGVTYLVYAGVMYWIKGWI